MWKLLPAAGAAPGRRVKEAAGSSSRERPRGGGGGEAVERASGPSSWSFRRTPTRPKLTGSGSWAVGPEMGAHRPAGGGMCVPGVDGSQLGCEPGDRTEALNGKTTRS